MEIRDAQSKTAKRSFLIELSQLPRFYLVSLRNRFRFTLGSSMLTDRRSAGFTSGVAASGDVEHAVTLRASEELNVLNDEAHGKNNFQFS